MSRRPLYGGTQGIPTNVNVHGFLPAYAVADFKHDFGGDKITANVLNDIETVGSRSKFFTLLQPLLGKSVYQWYGSNVPLSLPESAVIPTQDYTEEKLLSDIAKIPYDTFVASDISSVYGVAENVPILIAGQIPRRYTISRVAEKLKPDGKYTPQLATPTVPTNGIYANLLSCLWAASGKAGQRKKKFAIMYDAGNCATSEIGELANKAITELVNNPTSIFGEQFDKTASYDVYFINSSENLRDPAPKIVDRTFKKSSKAPNVNIYFLNDYGHRGNYTMYAKKAPGDQSANLYTSYGLSTIRDNQSERIRGTIEYTDGTKRQLDDLKRESEIESATTNAVSMYLQGSPPEKTMSCFVLKRSGDWCQALCLLDKERKYTITGYGSKTGTTTTLQQLENEGVEVMLMTHDRVLLAYALTLGLNVCFTNNRPSGHWIVYFKNADVFRISDWSEIKDSALRLSKQLGIHQNATSKVRKIYMEIFKSILWKNLPVDILRARFVTYVLANLVKDELFATQIKSTEQLLEEIKSYADIQTKHGTKSSIAEIDNANDQKRAKEASDVLGKLRNLLPNVQATINISSSILGEVKEKTTTPVITQGPITRSMAKSQPETPVQQAEDVDLEKVAEFLKTFSYPEQSNEVKTVVNFLLTFKESRPFKSSQKNENGEEYNLEAEFTLIAERLYDDFQSIGGSHIQFPNDAEIAENLQRGGQPLLQQVLQQDVQRGVQQILQQILLQGLQGVQQSVQQGVQQEFKRTHVSIVRSVFDIFKKTQIRARSGGQRGGNPVDDAYYLPAAIYAITQTAIPIVKEPNADTFGFTYQQHMTNYDRWKYFVVDPYLVTKEDRGTLAGAIATFGKASEDVRKQVVPKYILYLAFRLLILYVDLAYNEWILLSPENNPKTDDESIDRGEYVTPDEIALQLLRQRVDKLLEIVTALTNGQDILPLLVAYETFEPTFEPGKPVAVSPVVDLMKIYGFVPQMMTLIKEFRFGFDLFDVEQTPLDDGRRFFIPSNIPSNIAREFQKRLSEITTMFRYDSSTQNLIFNDRALNDEKVRTPVENLVKEYVHLGVKPAKDAPAKFVILLDPRNMSKIIYEINQNYKFDGPTLQIQTQNPNEPPQTIFFQNILTNVYVPLIPQPNVAQQQAALAQFGRQQGGLRTEEEESSNANLSRTDSARSNRNARLRRRTRPRRTYRVRKQSRKSKTR